MKKKTVTVTLLILMSVGFLFMPLSLVLGQAGVNIYLVSPAEQGVVAQNVNLQGTINTNNGAYQIWFGNKLVVSNNSDGYYVNANFTIPALPGGDVLVQGIQGKTLDDIMQAILQGVEKAFQKDKRPYTEITLPDKSAHSLGQFLQFKMMEMMFLGALCQVNPFDQPNVEAYKQETRSILEK